MIFANVDKPVTLKGKPVIPDNEFNNLKKEILILNSYIIMIWIYSNFNETLGAGIYRNLWRY